MMGKKRRDIVCQHCNKEGRHKAKQLCVKCYLKEWKKFNKNKYHYHGSHKSKKVISCRNCKLEKLHMAKGLCASCYSRTKHYIIENTPKLRFQRKLQKIQRKKYFKRIKHNFTLQDWDEKLLKSEGVCLGCNVNVGIGRLTMDYIYPISKAEEGRVYTINDVQPLCLSCNASKGNSTKERKVSDFQRKKL